MNRADETDDRHESIPTEGSILTLKLREDVSQNKDISGPQNLFFIKYATFEQTLICSI